MSNLIIGSNSKFGKILKEILPGTYLNKQEFDLLNPKFEQFKNITVDNVIFLSKGNSKNFSDVGKVCDSIFGLLDHVEYKTAWVFTSGLGTYIESKNNNHVFYSAEKMLINFVAYKKNHSTNNIKIIHPGHMETLESYQAMVNAFVELLNNPPMKNLIWSLPCKSYIPF
jgi:hypothetical protein